MLQKRKFLQYLIKYGTIAMKSLIVKMQEKIQKNMEK